MTPLFVGAIIWLLLYCPSVIVIRMRIVTERPYRVTMGTTLTDLYSRPFWTIKVIVFL